MLYPLINLIILILSTMGFEIGKDVVCIVDKPHWNLKEGDIKRAINVNGSPCACPCECVDVGIRCYAVIYCDDCKKDIEGDIIWFDYKTFIPLDQWQAAEEAKESLLKDLEIEILT